MEGDIRNSSVESVAAQSPCQLPQNVLSGRINNPVCILWVFGVI